MKIRYEFNDGTIKEIEVSDEVGNFITVSRREEENLARKERYHTSFSLDALVYEGQDFADNNSPVRAFNEQEEQERAYAFIQSLTDVQRKRLSKKFQNPSMSFRDIAKEEGVDIKTVCDTFNQIKNRYKKFFHNDTPQNT